ncbi:MAG: class I SAM-dependent methyltransferase [Burkholderiaceae bacterium]|nr:class I SAM-dependent methyltransferase [Burkholderiaceae bacterium]
MEKNTLFDPKQLKTGIRESWNKAASGWNEQTPQIHQWLASATQTMFDLAKIKSGSRVVDVAAGAGDQTLDAARRVGPTGYVLATDISAAILEFAAANAQRGGFNNVDTKVADAENLDLPAASFDAAICRLGLMLCPDPIKSLQGMHHALKPGSCACVMVFSQPEKNPCIGVLLQTAFKHAGLDPVNPYQPGGLFSLGKPGYLDELFVSAGFQDTATTTVPAVFNLPSTKAYLEFIRNSASPIIRILSKLSEPAREAAWQEIEERLQAFQTPAGWKGPNELLLTVGSRSVSYLA